MIDSPEDWSEIAAIRRAESHLAQVEADSKAAIAAAKDALRKSASDLASIPSTSDRLKVIDYAYNNTAAPKMALAFAFFGSENKLWHLRKLLSPSTRACDHCGKPWPTGNRFDSREFQCDPCSNSRSAELQAEWNARERQAIEIDKQRQLRILELRRASNLSPDEIDELVDLLAD